MDLTQSVDGYCERIDPSFWAEPVNAITNAAFLIAAIIMWRRSDGLRIAQLLCIILFAIGIGSFLFHTFAQTWAGMADVFPIILYILVYIFAATRDFYGQKWWIAALAVVLFFPYTAALVPLFQQIPGFESSAAYGPVPLLIFIYAFGLRNGALQTAKGLAIGASIVCLSLFFRSIDEPLCNILPLGTHFMWHILNGIALGWMIEIYRRHMLARPTKLG
ncbi:ceramidase domain-containing protein [Cognatishimia maritima]|uniref:Ceramidase n=1 Tax=Cognatishimia maritima TaxID=870908 RepID=A0A1M5JW54_9RHOB|nr:ceramidase domain-containing protein [Cognatishimia maritima]SHG44807.1 Ceramidase [Cognatishimia maritima]